MRMTLVCDTAMKVVQYTNTWFYSNKSEHTLLTYSSLLAMHIIIIIREGPGAAHADSAW